MVFNLLYSNCISCLYWAGRLENIVSWNETLVGISSKKLFLLGGFEAFLIVLIILLLTACLMHLPCIKTLNHAINKH